MAEVVTDPRELVRVRVERALATEDVNLASEQGRARAQTLIESLRTVPPCRILEYIDWLDTNRWCPQTRNPNTAIARLEKAMKV